MRKLLSHRVLMLALSLCFFQTAQSQNTIRGLVQDAKAQTMSAATALLRLTSDSSLVKGVICTEQGAFLFDNTASGIFFVEINMLGYSSTVSKPFTVKENEGTIDLGTLILSEDNTMLNEVL